MVSTKLEKISKKLRVTLERCGIISNVNSIVNFVTFVDGAKVVLQSG